MVPKVGGKICIATTPKDAGKLPQPRLPGLPASGKSQQGVRIFALGTEAPASFSQCALSCESHLPELLLGVQATFQGRPCQSISAQTEPEMNQLDLFDSLQAAVQESGLVAV